MDQIYRDLIEQTFYFPQDGFNVKENELQFHGIDLMKLIEKYKTPLKFTYLPKISENIQNAKRLFNQGIEKHDYNGKYHYAYCTKSSHFSFVIKEALKNSIHLETSSAFDIEIIRNLHKEGVISKDIMIICNGFKRPAYIKNICALINDGFHNTIPILDNVYELDKYLDKVSKKFKVGIRIAAEEEPSFYFYTSRLGIRYKDIFEYYMSKIKDNPQVELSMLHFFINTGIQDTSYYWSELSKSLNVYCQLKRECKELKYLDIGGGFPIQKTLNFEYDYEYMSSEIISQIKEACISNEVEEPDIVTEFGSYTVGESGATIFRVMDDKQQNDSEMWYMINGSFITSLPDTYSLNYKFILLAVNHWDKEYQPVNIGGLTCDSLDFYNSEANEGQVFLPKLNSSPLYIGFFHTGAYQESIGGFGGISHCLIPAPKHIVIQKHDDGTFTDELFAAEQNAQSMLNTLGY